jgi:hypothetical protein
LKHSLARIPNSLLGFVAKRFTPDKIRFYCVVFLAANVVLVAARFATTKDGQTVFGYPLARDYTAFYVAGKIANEHTFARAYDIELQSRVYHELLPREPPEAQLPYVNPPFLLIPFSILSRLPYAWAFAAWLTISICLYVAGVLLMLRATSRLPRESQATVLPLALAFAPFLIYCWGLGQLSSIGVFCIASGIYFEKQGKPYLSGILLSLCLYKPTLLALLIPMLIITRRFHTLVGFSAGAAALLGASAWLIGWRGLAAYARLLEDFRRWKGTANAVSQISLYVDIRTAFKLLTDSYPSSAVAINAVYIAGILLLAWTWWRFGQESLVWALTITWSLVLNVYTPLYDTTLLVIPTLLVADHLYGAREQILPTTFKGFIVLLYLLPLTYFFLANTGGFEVYTLLIISFGIYQLRLFDVRVLCERGASKSRLAA